MKFSIFALASTLCLVIVKAQSPYPDDEFFIEHAHSELVADIQFGTLNEGQPVILYNEQDKGAPNQLWTFTHEGYIKSSAGNFYLAIEGNRGQVIPDGTSVIISEHPQIWDYHNGALTTPGLLFGISYDGPAAANTRLVMKELDVHDKTQQFRLERLYEEVKSGQIESQINTSKQQ
ncbi:unnamed protein product [Cunninghamella blakesleeana]